MVDQAPLHFGVQVAVSNGAASPPPPEAGWNPLGLSADSVDLEKCFEDVAPLFLSFSIFPKSNTSRN